MGMNFSDEMQAIIANLESREWIQGIEVDGEKVCAHGAVKTCEALRPGDEYIIRAVMRRRGLTETWNDKGGRTKAEVLAMMRQIEVSDADLEATFGPNWWLVIAAVRRAATLTLDEAQRMAAARHAGRATAQNAAWAAAGDAALDAGRSAARNASRDAAWTAAVDGSWPAAGDAARNSAVAVVVADLVGQHGLTQDHIDTLMKPWIDVLGNNWAEEVTP